MKLALLLPATAALLGAADLVRDGASRHTIVISRAAAPAERRAAEELQKFLREISGASLPLADDSRRLRGPLLLVGRSGLLRRVAPDLPPPDLGPEGFVIAARGQHLVIAGGGPRGTLYGVYEFLERLGCRWFTADVSRIPRLRTILLPGTPVRQEPAFEYREPFFTEAFDRDWAARNRANGHHAQLDESTGGKISYYPFVHSFYQLVPPEKYFADHPEYFSLIDGRRRAERGQLCLTHPEVLRIATAAVERWIAEHPEATIFSVSQNDWEGWCECDRCRRVEEEEGGAHSGPVLRFVNALAEQIESRHPDRLIDTLAYWYTEAPPARVRPRRNVRVRLCPIGICTAHSFATCPRSAYFYRNLQAWSKITGQLYVWHYNTNFTHYLLPFPDFDELAADIPLYRRLGVKGLFMQGAYPPGGGGEMSWLRAWVIARLLWDPTRDASKLVDEFLEGVYGRAAGPLRKYFDLLHSEVRPAPAGRGLHLWIFNVPDYSPRLLEEGMRLFDEAEKAAAGEAVRRRIRKDRLSLEYLSLLWDLRYEVREGRYAPPDLAALREKARAFLASAREHGLQSLHEGRSIDFDGNFFAGLREYEVLSLENRQWRVDVVPELGGRVVRLFDKAGGRELLRRPPLHDLRYPDAGGIAATLHRDRHSSPWPVRWRVERPAQDQILLSAPLESGLQAQHRIVLSQRGLALETRLANPTAETLEAAIAHRAEIDPVDIDAEALVLAHASGATTRRKLIEPEKEPAGRLLLDAPGLPAGGWWLEPSGFFASFEEAARVAAQWTAKTPPGVTLVHWTGEQRLAPGGALRLESFYSRR
ncbi:MAG: DUF4838 domain-containing protein [Bryobacteraceae bacterium]|nr:DUF4838 domain-containing protein [Bryobacteraceae bacterium]